MTDLQEEMKQLEAKRDRLLRELQTLESRLNAVRRSASARRGRIAESDDEDLFDNLPV